VEKLPDLNTGKKILIAPLNWGLGHATRLIPVIRHYRQSNNIIIAGNQPSLNILTQAFPELKAIELPQQNFTFDTRFFSVKNLFHFFRQLNRSIEDDRTAIKSIVKTHNIDIIISDNRYGLRHSATKNILITHQLMLKLPPFLSIFEKAVHLKVINKIKSFDECWIPDFEDNKNLSGDLSHKYPLPENTRFIAPLSRFQNPVPPSKGILRKILVILSGPEPQRTEFEKRWKHFW